MAYIILGLHHIFNLWINFLKTIALFYPIWYKEIIKGSSHHIMWISGVTTTIRPLGVEKARLLPFTVEVFFYYP